MLMTKALKSVIPIFAKTYALKRTSVRKVKNLELGVSILIEPLVILKNALSTVDMVARIEKKMMDQAMIRRIDV